MLLFLTETLAHWPCHFGTEVSSWKGIYSKTELLNSGCQSDRAGESRSHKILFKGRTLVNWLQKDSPPNVPISSKYQYQLLWNIPDPNHSVLLWSQLPNLCHMDRIHHSHIKPARKKMIQQLRSQRRRLPGKLPQEWWKVTPHPVSSLTFDSSAPDPACLLLQLCHASHWPR